MIKITEWLLIREYLASGNTISQISRLTGRDRKNHFEGEKK